MSVNDSPPLVCICIPTYNAEHTILETLQSIINQSYQNTDIHVVDNASTDNTLKIVAEFNDVRIQTHLNDINIGAEGNFTRCIDLAAGKYTAIYHADDVYEQNMVEKQVKFLEANADVGAVFTQAITINEQGTRLGAIGQSPVGDKGVERFNFCDLFQSMLLNHNFLVCPSAMVRTEIYTEQIKSWGSSMFKSSSDIDTWLRLASHKPIAVLHEQLMRYRISGTQFSDKIRNRTERADFFLVMDYYLTKPEVHDFISKNDLRYYGWLLRHDQVVRAFNLFSKQSISESKNLLQGFFCWDTFYAAIHN
ncbi:MAG: glycosyltransferase family A protein, partial [Methylophilaceae bacterium]